MPGRRTRARRARLGDAVVKPLLRFGDRLVLAPFALNVHAPALLAQSRFALAIDIALVGQDVAIRVGRIKHVFKMRGVVFAGRAHLDFAYQLVSTVTNFDEKRCGGDIVKCDDRAGAYLGELFVVPSRRMLYSGSRQRSVCDADVNGC